MHKFKVLRAWGGGAVRVQGTSGSEVPSSGLDVGLEVYGLGFRVSSFLQRFQVFEVCFLPLISCRVKKMQQFRSAKADTLLRKP